MAYMSHASGRFHKPRYLYFTWIFLHWLHEIWILTWQPHTLRGTKINAILWATQICVQNLTATHVTVCTNVMDRQIGFCAILPSRQTDRWSVRQSRASASAFALWDFKWGVMCSQVCLYWPFHSSSKAIQLNRSWGVAGGGEAICSEATSSIASLSLSSIFVPLYTV